MSTSRLTSVTLPVAPLAPSRRVTVAPLHGLQQADMIVIASSSLSAGTLAAIQRLPGVTGAQAVEAAKVQVDGKYCSCQPALAR